MNARDEYLIMQGVLLGAAIAAYQQQQQMALLDQRVQKIERGVKPALRVLRRLVPAGRRDGQRVYRIGGML